MQFAQAEHGECIFRCGLSRTDVAVQSIIEFKLLKYFFAAHKLN